MKDVTAEVVGHMVRFLPRQEHEHKSGNATTVLHPKLGRYILVCVEGEINQWHTLTVSLDRWDKEMPPEVVDKEAVMDRLRKEYPCFTAITLKEKKDDKGVKRFSLR